VQKVKVSTGVSGLFLSPPTGITDPRSPIRSIASVGDPSEARPRTVVADLRVLLPYSGTGPPWVPAAMRLDRTGV
jgi:hypothetical protein